MSTDSRSPALPVHECLKLLASVPVGRIVYTRKALPAVEPVRFALDGGTIVFRINPSGALAPAIQHTVVAFQSDYLDHADHSGWSVTVIGHASEIIDPLEITRLRAIGLQSWAPAHDDCYFRIVAGIINGQILHWPASYVA